MLATVRVFRHVGQSKVGTLHHLCFRGFPTLPPRGPRRSPVVVRLSIRVRERVLAPATDQSESFFFFVAVFVSALFVESEVLASADLPLLLPSLSDLDFPLAASASALAAFL